MASFIAGCFIGGMVAFVTFVLLMCADDNGRDDGDKM